MYKMYIFKTPPMQTTREYQDLKLLHLNIGRGFQNKIDKLQMELVKIKPEIVIGPTHRKWPN